MVVKELSVTTLLEIHPLIALNYHQTLTSWCHLAKHALQIGSTLALQSERAYGKTGNGNETETGNGNWKWKLEREMETKRTNHWCNFFFIVCFGHMEKQEMEMKWKLEMETGN